MKNIRIIIVAFGVSLLTSTACAHNIIHTIEAAKKNNTKIKSVREDYKTVKVERIKAYTTLLPDARVNIDYGKTHYLSDVAKQSVGREDSRTTSLVIQQPIFSGGATLFRINRANNQIKGAEYGLIGQKQNTVLNAIIAYETLLTSYQIEDFNIKNEEVLSKHLTETQARYDLGEATITDVSQSKSRAASAQADKIKSSGDVMAAKAFYEHIVGEEAPVYMDEIDISNIPTPHCVEELLDIVLRKNPSILKAHYDSKAAMNSKQLAYSELSPKVNASARLVRSDSRKTTLNTTDGNFYALSVQIPIFQTGAEYANIRSAKYQHRKAKYDYEEYINTARENTIRAWTEYTTTKSVMESTAEAIAAAQSALEGVIEEAKVGTRTTLDILDAEQELFNAKVKNRIARRDHIISLFRMHELMSTLNEIKIV